MNAAEVMSALSTHDASVVIEGERVRLLHPVGNPPPPELIEAARQHREALRAMLAGEQQNVAARPFGKELAAFRSACPELLEPPRWQQAIRDADSFFLKWGQQAQALGWTARELFGLHSVPERPAPTYCRLLRYDATGLIWLLQGRPVVALTETEAAIQGATTVLVYRKQRKTALGTAGDSLDEIGVVT
jgi:hypothetical protein